MYAVIKKFCFNLGFKNKIGRKMISVKSMFILQIKSSINGIYMFFTGKKVIPLIFT